MRWEYRSVIEISLWPIKGALTSRLKILSNLDITERRKPQDGRFRLRLGPRKTVDLRVSTLPTLFGEKIVLRILDQTNSRVDARSLGLMEEDFEKFKELLVTDFKKRHEGELPYCMN